MVVTHIAWRDSTGIDSAAECGNKKPGTNKRKMADRSFLLREKIVFCR